MQIKQMKWDKRKVLSYRWQNGLRGKFQLAQRITQEHLKEAENEPASFVTNTMV